MPHHKASVRKATPISDAASYFSKSYFARQTATAEQAPAASTPYGGYQALQSEPSAHAPATQSATQAPSR